MSVNLKSRKSNNLYLNRNKDLILIRELKNSNISKFKYLIYKYDNGKAKILFSEACQLIKKKNYRYELKDIKIAMIQSSVNSIASIKLVRRLEGSQSKENIRFLG